MPVRTRCPRLTTLTCSIYRLMIWTYPAAFRRAFTRELQITFRNQAEDALDAGIVASLRFATRVFGDWWATWALLALERDMTVRRSLLGLRANGEQACGGLEQPLVDVASLFAAAGVVLLVVGWYVFVATTPTASGNVVHRPGSVILR